MAAGWLRHLAGDRVEVRFAGSEPADQINRATVEAMREVGTDITDQTPGNSSEAQPGGGLGHRSRRR
jgi:arsenate reductase (thioredoxin)